MPPWHTLSDMQNKRMIETERTVLRWFCNDDVDGVLSFMGNPEVMRFSLGGPYDRRKCEEFIQIYATEFFAQLEQQARSNIKHELETLEPARRGDQQAARCVTKAS